VSVLCLNTGRNITGRNITQSSNTQPLEFNPNVYLLNVVNHTWVGRFRAFPIQDSSASTEKIVIGTTVGIISTIAIMVVTFYIYRFRRRRKTPPLVNY